MRRFVFILPWVTGLLLCALMPLAAAPTTKLNIHVTSPTGKPVDRASIIIKFVKGREKMKLGKRDRRTWETKTDQLGTAKIPPIPQGTIQVQVIASNYQTFGDVFEVDEDEKTIEIKLKDPQPQYSAH